MAALKLGNKLYNTCARDGPSPDALPHHSKLIPSIGLPPDCCRQMRYQNDSEATLPRYIACPCVVGPYPQPLVDGDSRSWSNTRNTRSETVGAQGSKGGGDFLLEYER
jgi:hypothetical protein